MASLSSRVKLKDKDSTEEEVIMMIDSHNIAYIVVYAEYLAEYGDGDFGVFPNSFYNIFFNLVKRIKPDKLVMAFDTRGPWRKKIYEEYKDNRKKQQSGKYPIDKKAFNIKLEEIAVAMDEVFTNICSLRINECEGDDIIAVLAKKVFNKENQRVVIVSRDGDLNQLTGETHISQFNPVKWEYFNILNPKKELQNKILIGDKSDNIPNIKYGIGKVKAMKILDSPEGIDGFINEQETDLEKKTIKERYEMNTQLIDLNFIPINIQNRILDKYNEWESKPLDVKKVVNYFIKGRIPKARRNWAGISPHIIKLK